MNVLGIKEYNLASEVRFKIKALRHSLKHICNFLYVLDFCNAHIQYTVQCPLKLRLDSCVQCTLSLFTVHSVYTAHAVYSPAALCSLIFDPKKGILHCQNSQKCSKGTAVNHTRHELWISLKVLVRFKLKISKVILAKILNSIF